MMEGNKGSALAIGLVTLLLASFVSVTLAGPNENQMGLHYGMDKVRLVQEKLEALAMGKQPKDGIPLNATECLAAIKEKDKWHPRVAIRIKRAEPLIHLTTWLIEPLKTLEDKEHGEAIKRMELLYKLFRKQCLEGTIDYFQVKSDVAEKAIGALILNHDMNNRIIHKQKLSLDMVKDVRKEFLSHLKELNSIQISEEKRMDLFWLLAYVNDPFIVVLKRDIFPMIDPIGTAMGGGKLEKLETMSDIFTDEMRRRGFYVDRDGSLTNHNLDIDQLVVASNRGKSLLKNSAY